MFNTSISSCHSRDDTRLKEYPMMFPNKLNPQEFLCYEEILICPFVLEYTTLAINLSLLQHSHLKLDTLDRKEEIFARKPDSYSSVSCKSARSRHYYIAKSARSRHYYLTYDHAIHRACVQESVVEKSECC